jgi:hypothetical protein
VRWLLVICLQLCFCQGPTTAETLIVDIGGNGDFDSLPAALEAAQDGDTILLRPGRYDALTNDEYGGRRAYGIIRAAELTLRAEQLGDVIIGPAQQPVWAIDTPRGLASDYWTGVDGLTLENLIVENVFDGVVAGASTTIDHCVFHGCYGGFRSETGQILIADSVFQDCESNCITIHAEQATIRDCIIGPLPPTGRGIHFFRCPGGERVLSTEFFDEASVVFQRSAAGLVQDCNFETGGVALVSGAYADLLNNGFSDAGFISCVQVHDESYAFAVSNDFGGRDDSTIVVSGKSQATFRDNWIGRRGGWAVRVMHYGSPKYLLDFRDNRWQLQAGETMPDVLSDGMDPGQESWPVVLYRSVLERPMSFSELRSKF